ncbi:MAG: peptidoglycan bridge formation glycyltransferase FemA/FemB family protein [Patescibacteria group bacterium]
MLVRDVTATDKELFNRAATHPLQSYEWGEFRQATGVEVIRKGIFEGKKLITPVQVTIHRTPKLNWNIGYFPKGPMPDENQLNALKQIGKENNCVMIKLEPNVNALVNNPEKPNQTWKAIGLFLRKRGCFPGRPLFTKHTFILNLKNDEEQLLAKMQPKTRYNLRLAEKKGVKIVRDNSDANFKWFVKLLFEETLIRQGFYAHNPEYFQKLWSILKPAGMAHLMRAEYNGQPLAVYMVFIFNGKIYYPYGASSREHKELMAPNLLMWEIIKLGKKMDCESLDMWGALGPKPKPNDPWYGFHRFKQGYGGDLTESLGTYDLVLDLFRYPLYRVAEQLRWTGLKLKTKIKI